MIFFHLFLYFSSMGNYMNVNINEKISDYEKSKDLATRNNTLKTLVFEKDEALKNFFLKAFKRERYLDMKLTAARGYAQYASENDVVPLMKKFMELLKKRQETTPYNYQEYEMIRSAFGLPYLIETYGYNCFKEVFAQEEIQYNSMPDCFKGIFTYDKKGEYVQLISHEESKRRMDDFYSRI